MKGIKSLLGHAGFYRRLTKEFFSRITKPLCNLLERKAAFKFDEDSLQVFEELKEKLVSTPIVKPPNWSLLFEIMCDVSENVIGAILDQHLNKISHNLLYK